MAIQVFRLLFSPFEHFEHAIRDQESADDVGDGSRNGDETQDLAQLSGVLIADDEDRADHGDRGDRVSQRHQGSVQKGRDFADYFEANEGRQHEDVKADF